MLLRVVWHKVWVTSMRRLRAERFFSRNVSALPARGVCYGSLNLLFSRVGTVLEGKIARSISLAYRRVPLLVW